MRRFPCPVCGKEGTLISGRMFRCESDGDCRGVEFYFIDHEPRVTIETVHISMRARAKEVSHGHQPR